MQRTARWLPRGWGDLLRQVALVTLAYYAYRIVRGIEVDDPARAFAHARAIVGIERSLGIFTEPQISGWVSDRSVFTHVASWAYVYSHFVVTTAALAWLYLRRNASFYFVRNMFLVAMALAIVGYLAYPTAPPRFMRELGFGDPVADVTGVEPTTSGTLVNPYAAVPSMHVAFALMIGGALVDEVRSRWARALWIAYPVFVTFVVVGTANHWWFDAATGALVAIAATAAARALAGARPGAWARHPVTASGG